MPKKSATPKKDESGTLSVRVSVNVNDDTALYYINFAEIAHSQNEFVIVGARLPTKPDRASLELAQKTGTFDIGASVQLLVPPPVMKALLGAIELQISRYEGQYGKIQGSKDVA